MGRSRRFDITPGGQQIHIAIGPAEVESARHPCFKLYSLEALLELQERIYVSCLSFLRSRSRENKIEANGKDGYWKRGHHLWDWDAAPPCYACSSLPIPSLCLGNPQPRGIVLWPSPPDSCNHFHILSANRPSSNRSTSHPPAEKADRAQQTGPAKRIVGRRGWGFRYASLQGTSRAIDWSSVCKSTRLGEKADGRVETREEKSVEGMDGKIDRRARACEYQ